MWELWQQQHYTLYNKWNARASFRMSLDSSAKENNNWKRWVRYIKPRDKPRGKNICILKEFPSNVNERRTTKRKKKGKQIQYELNLWRSASSLFGSCQKTWKKLFLSTILKDFLAGHLEKEFEQLYCFSLRSNLCLCALEQRCFYFLSNTPAAICYWRGEKKIKREACSWMFIW